MDPVVGGDDIQEVSMEDATGTGDNYEEPYSSSPYQGSFVPSVGPAVALVYQNEKGDLVGPEGSAKSVDEYLNCRLCQLKFDAVKEAMVHYNGAPHKEMLHALAETQGLTITTNQTANRGKRKASAGNESNKFKKMPDMMDDISSGIFVDKKGALWGAEKNAKTLGEFKHCRICSITASSFKTAKEHYTGNKHTKMLKRRADDEGLVYKLLGKKLYVAVAQGPIERDEDPMGVANGMKTQIHKEAAAEREDGDYNEEEAEAAEQDAKNEEVSNKRPQDLLPSKVSETTGQIKPNSDMFCWTCMVVLTSKQTADLHYAGKKHAKVLAQQQYGTDVTKHGKPTLDLAGSGVLYCTPCDVMCITRDQLDEHFESEKHSAVLAAEKKRQEDAKKATDGDLGYGCRICDVRLNSKQTYLEHQESKKHLKKFYMKEEQKMGFPGYYPPFPGVYHGPFERRGPGFGEMGPDGWDRGRPFEDAGPPPFGRGPGNGPRGPPPFGRGLGRWEGGGPRGPPPFARGQGRWNGDGPRGPPPFGRGPGRWEGDGPRDQRSWENAGPPPFGRESGRWEGDGPMDQRPWGDAGPSPFGRESGRREGDGPPSFGRKPGRDGPRDKMGQFPYRDVRKDSEGPNTSSGPPASETSDVGVVDFSKALTSGNNLSETLLNLLPKEALLKLAMEALASKSKELVGSDSTGGQRDKQKKQESWNQDEDYRSYQFERTETDYGMERGFPGRGRGRGSHSPGQRFEGNRGTYGGQEKGYTRGFGRARGSFGRGY